MAYAIESFTANSAVIQQRLIYGNKREARSAAYREACRLGIARPVWVDGNSSWNETDDVIGGYDAGGIHNPGGYGAIVRRL